MFFNAINKRNTEASDQLTVLSPGDFKSAINDGKVQLADVRTAQEFAAGHIESAENIDVFQAMMFETKFEKYDKQKPVYLYCRSGGRSQTAAKKLIAMGFQKIYDLRGGYMAWSR